MSSSSSSSPPARPRGVPDDVEIEMVDVAGEQLAILSWPVSRRAASSSVVSVLSPTEEVVLRGIAMGRSNAEIARERGTSPRTVANQVATLLKKFGVASRYELVVAMSQRSDDSGGGGGGRDGS